MRDFNGKLVPRAEAKRPKRHFFDRSCLTAPVHLLDRRSVVLETKNHDREDQWEPLVSKRSPHS